MSMHEEAVAKGEIELTRMVNDGTIMANNAIACLVVARIGDGDNLAKFCAFYPGEEILEQGEHWQPTVTGAVRVWLTRVGKEAHE